jgi:uncharacterized ion transporter superfamily protein YfcC
MSINEDEKEIEYEWDILDWCSIILLILFGILLIYSLLNNKYDFEKASISCIIFIIIIYGLNKIWENK